MNVDKIFTYHKPNDDQITKYTIMRALAKDIAFQIENLCPDGIEKDNAISRLRECIMWANASIAINESM